MFPIKHDRGSIVNRFWYIAEQREHTVGQVADFLAPCQRPEVRNVPPGCERISSNGYIRVDDARRGGVEAT
jgi:hypothetical protein